jgi:hypothetical protein
MSPRKSPRLHKVSDHERGDTHVTDYVRGSGTPPEPQPRKRAIVQEPYRTINLNGETIDIYHELLPQEKQGLDYYQKYKEFESKLGASISGLYWGDLESFGSRMANYVFTWDKDVYDSIDEDYSKFKAATAHNNYSDAILALAGIAKGVKEVNREAWQVRGESKPPEPTPDDEATMEQVLSKLEESGVDPE